MLTKALALSWAPEGIRVNAVAPGYIETSINEAGRQDLAHYSRIAERTAFKRWGSPKMSLGPWCSCACRRQATRPVRLLPSTVDSSLANQSQAWHPD